MFPLLAALPAVASAAASLFGQERANTQTRDMAREQMGFQERMSSTAYQRATQDMRLAGLNPMLAYMQGGASSPGGAMATMQDAIGPAVNSAISATRLRQELNVMKEQADATHAQADKAKAEKDAIYGYSYSAGGREIYRPGVLDSTAQSIAESKSRTALNLAGLPAAGVMGSKTGGWLQMVLRALGGVSDVARAVKPGLTIQQRR